MPLPMELILEREEIISNGFAIAWMRSPCVGESAGVRFGYNLSDMPTM